MLITQKLWKRSRLKNVVFWILLLQTCLILAQKKVLVIDAGHGGTDSGAIAKNKLKEKDVVLDIAFEILKLNKTLFKNEFDIYLTRYKDTLISLSDRTRLAKALKADVFVSLHCNASKTNSKGIEVYAHTVKKENTNASIALGLKILNEATDKLAFKKRGVKLANFQVLRELKDCPAVLVELGFMTNMDEANYFKKPKHKSALALSLLLGITNYLKLEL